MRQPRKVGVILLILVTAAILLTVSSRWSMRPSGPPAGSSYPLPVRYMPSPGPTAIGSGDILAQASGAQAQRFQNLTPQAAAAFNASQPVSPLPLIAARAFRLPAGTDSAGENRPRALQCLSLAVYYEAGSESAQGQAAVAQVVLNRVRHPIFPKTVCGVVFQGSQLPTGCQFTFTCDGSLARPPEPTAWARAQMIAQRALAGYVEPSVGAATHYHTQWVVPYWEASLVKLTQIGAHIFYRWSGSAGLPAAFNGAYAGDEPALPILALSAIPDAPTDPTTQEALGKPVELARTDAEQTVQTPMIATLKTPSPEPMIAAPPADLSSLGSLSHSQGDAAHPVVPAILAQSRQGFGSVPGSYGR